MTRIAPPAPARKQCKGLSMTEAEQLLAKVIADMVDEATWLETLGDCSPEEFDLRLIRLGNEQTVAIRHANKAQLELLAGQLRAAGLPIPAPLEHKLANAA